MVDSNAYHYGGATGYWFYVDGPEAGKLMTFGPAQVDDHYDKTLKLVNTMTLAKDAASKIAHPRYASPLRYT